MASKLLGKRNWRLSRDSEGHRDYRIMWLIEADISDGPAVILTTSGLPQIGAVWAFGNDLDGWAFCHPEWTVRPVLKKEPNILWELEQVFSTRPLTRPQDNSVQDPLAEPDRISGSFLKLIEREERDKDGVPITLPTGQPVQNDKFYEKSDNKPTVIIEQNVSPLGLEDFSPMIDTVNDSVLWGLPARTIKLADTPWQRRLTGTSSFYYVRTLEFEIDFNTWDKASRARDKFFCPNGEQTLCGKGDPDVDPDPYPVVADPDDCVNDSGKLEIWLDRDCRPADTWLDDNGRRVADHRDAAIVTIQHFEESNFLTLGIPSTIGG